ncbi:MAG: immunoglobulin domain-containing protein [Planctomycetaceae bacterium]|nr:immunoglobulin domain-containing protein [Planctomycetaceae bacterium]
MRKIINRGFGILVVVLVSAAVRAELQSIENFDTRAAGNMPHNAATIGGGGVLATNTTGTSGNVVVETNSGSTVIRFMTTTDGTNSRGFGVAALDNTIENTESGLAFFRFAIRAEGNAADTYLGIHALEGDTPFSPAGNDPENYLVAGIHLVNGTGSAVNVVKMNDINAILMSGLTRGTFYNCWIDVDNAANTYDVYISEAAGPAGAATLPTSADLIADDLPFDNTAAYGTSPLTGVFFDTPRLSSTTRSSTQSARTFIDEIWWDGDAGLVFASKGARNPVPVSGSQQMPLNQVLSWEAPDDPNVAQVLGYDVYFDPNQTLVQNSDPGVVCSTGQLGLSYGPIPDMAYDTTYYWRVRTMVKLDDPNQTVQEDAGKVWHFSTLSSFPTITLQPVDLIAEAGQTAQFTVAADSIRPASYQWYKSADRANNTAADDTALSGATAAILTISPAEAADEGFYYCRVSNPSATDSNAAALAVKREVAHWTLNQSDYDAINGKYADVVNDYDATVALAGAVPVFVDGIASPQTNGAVAFDPNTYGLIGPLNPSQFSNQLTLSAWVKWDGTPLPGPDTNGNVILQKGGSYTTVMWTWKIRDNNATHCASRFYNNFGVSAATALLIEANVWTHVCATWDGAAARVYIDGELAATDTSGTLGTDTAGMLQLAGVDDFNGELDDVRIFNTAYDNTAIALELYNPISGKAACVNRTDPILVQYDYNDNCIVDLADFAMMASHWMDCFSVPDCIERPL